MEVRKLRLRLKQGPAECGAMGNEVLKGVGGVEYDLFPEVERSEGSWQRRRAGEKRIRGICACW
jgi:hypothetical protein